METINVIQMAVGKGGTCFLGERPFSGFAIPTFRDGRLRKQLFLMRDRLDGVTWQRHPNRAPDSEGSFRNGTANG